jgi:hypothetical protein
VEENHQKFCHILNADMDVYFQTDPFSCFFGMSCNNSDSVRHVFAENPSYRIGTCPVHQMWYQNDCNGLGRQYIEAHREKERICASITVGLLGPHRHIGSTCVK